MIRFEYDGNLVNYKTCLCLTHGSTSLHYGYQEKYEYVHLQLVKSDPSSKYIMKPLFIASGAIVGNVAADDGCVDNGCTSMAPTAKGSESPKTCAVAECGRGDAAVAAASLVVGRVLTNTCAVAECGRAAAAAGGVVVVVTDFGVMAL